MTVSSEVVPRLGRRRVMFALGDQVLWSAAFFLFTANLGLGATTDFAQVAVATAFGLIVLAVTRTWVIDSALLFAPGRPRSARRTSGLFFVAGTVAATAYVGWTALVLWEPVHWPAALLAFGLVFGDSTRYTWTTSGRSDRSLPLSSGYFVGAVLALVATWRDVPADWVIVFWALVLCALGTAGRADGPEPPGIARELATVQSRRVGLALEAMYFMAASQAALLMLSVMGHAADVAGLRLAYAVALAPAALLIQAGATQVLRLQGTSQGTSRGLRVGHVWGWACVGAYALNTVGVLLALEVSGATPLQLAAPFMVPLCLLLSAQAVSSGLHTVLRYHVTVRTSTTLRVATLSLEVALQLGGTVIGGTDGLVAGMYAGAALRMVLAVWLSWWLHRMSRGTHA